MSYFTYAKVNGKRMRDAFAIRSTTGSTTIRRETVLTLHFTLPFKNPVAVKLLLIEVYDPEFFVDFGPEKRTR